MVAEIERADMGGDECPWTNEELQLIAVVVRMMDIDPTFERLERVFERALKLVRSFKEGC